MTSLKPTETRVRHFQHLIDSSKAPAFLPQLLVSGYWMEIWNTLNPNYHNFVLQIFVASVSKEPTPKVSPAAGSKVTERGGKEAPVRREAAAEQVALTEEFPIPLPSASSDNRHCFL